MLVYRRINETCCLRCKKAYSPKENDFGQCEECNWKEHRELLKNYLDPNSFNVRKPVAPQLDPSLVARIREFVCENYGTLFKKKKEAAAFVNRKFGISLSQETVESITHTSILRRLGMRYRHRDFKGSKT